MSKGQHGNKEAKKPKMVRAPVKPDTPEGLVQTLAVAPIARQKKR